MEVSSPNAIVPPKLENVNIIKQKKIISEEEAKSMKPDYFLVLPWHFKENILKREKEYIANGGKFIFPLPEIEIV